MQCNTGCIKKVLHSEINLFKIVNNFHHGISYTHVKHVYFWTCCRFPHRIPMPTSWDILIWMTEVIFHLVQFTAITATVDRILIDSKLIPKQVPGLPIVLCWSILIGKLDFVNCQQAWLAHDKPDIITVIIWFCFLSERAREPG